MTTQDTINTFIIKTVLITPIEKIISQLNNNEFSDCDVKWLNAKLHDFVEFAAKTLYIGCPEQSESKIPTKMNTYAKSYYLAYFNQLLTYFKTL